MSGQPALQPSEGDHIKRVPADSRVRDRIRALAAEAARGMPRDVPPTRERLGELAGQVLARLGMPEEYLGFTMVAVSNGFWREQFEAIPTNRRLLLLPRCLRHPDRCPAETDSVGLYCEGCGACSISGLLAQARALGYETIVAEGTSAVIMKVLEGEADAILGVACLDSLDESFDQVADLGVPNQAVPLLTDGCVATEAESKLIAQLLTTTRRRASAVTRTPIPLLRETRAIFEPDALRQVLAEHVDRAALDADSRPGDPMLVTESLGVDWLSRGGKRLRPFVTVAAYTLGEHGRAALEPDASVAKLVPPSVRALAVAIEALHKASLAHDDIADADDRRYGAPTLHRAHGVGQALNVGDWLVGLGYRLIAAQRDALGAECVSEVLAHLSQAQLELCRGQGAELECTGLESAALRPVHALEIGALKTAPAFEIALYAGLRASATSFDRPLLKRYSTYLGEAYQVLNDLEDWRLDRGNKASLGRDALSGRPTILRAFAIEAGGWERLAAIQRRATPEEIVSAVRAAYADTGAFEKAAELVKRLRDRCLALADEATPEALGELLRFLVRAILRDRFMAARGL